MKCHKGVFYLFFRRRNGVNLLRFSPPKSISLIDPRPIPCAMATLSLLEGGDDAGATVRAALAFIDECDRELARFPDGGRSFPIVESLPSPEASRSDSSPDKAMQKGGALRNPSRDKKKQEILALRGQVAELTARLTQLQRSKCGHHTGNSISSGEVADGGAGSQLCRLWRDVAHRHRRLRSQADAENGELRAAIRRQLDVIQLMRKMLVRQTQVDVSTEHKLFAFRSLMRRTNLSVFAISERWLRGSGSRTF